MNSDDSFNGDTLRDLSKTGPNEMLMKWWKATVFPMCKEEALKGNKCLEIQYSNLPAPFPWDSVSEFFKSQKTQYRPIEHNDCITAIEISW